MVRYEKLSGGITNFIPPNKKIVRNPFWKDELAEKMAKRDGVHVNVIREYLGMELINE